MIDILNKNSINLTNKFGFTLAEVLITLGIVGVVAAMTIPNVVKNYKAIVLRSQLNKAYSSFAQATQMILTQEFDNTNQFENISVSEFLIYLQKYMKKAVKCDRYEKCPKNIFPSERNATLGVNFIAMNYKTYTGNKMNISDISDAAIVLQDSTFAVVDGDTTKYITKIFFFI